MNRIQGISRMAIAIMLAAPAIGQAHAAEAALSAQHRFDIAPTDLRTAISQFSQATGLQVVVAPAAVAAASN